MINDSDVYDIGTLTKTHGVAGELNFAFTDDAWDSVDADRLMVRVDGLLVPFFIEQYRFRSDTTAIIKFEGVDDETMARQLAGCSVYLERSLLTDDIQPQYTWRDFIGLTLNTTQYPDSKTQKLKNSETPLGTITDVDDSTENVLFTIATPDGNEHLVPAAEDLIDDIDWQARTITMNIPQGLLEL